MELESRRRPSPGMDQHPGPIGSGVGGGGTTWPRPDGGHAGGTRSARLPYLSRVVAVIAGCMFAGSSCAANTVSSDQLSPGAAKVQVVGDAAIDGCAFLGPISKQLGSNFRSLERNFELATIEVQNAASEKGATHIVLELQATDRNPWAMGGCNNCVLALARAYDCTLRP